jgi:hypothetical protein
VTERRTLGDLDFDSELVHPDDDGWFGSALMAPVSPPAVGDLRLDALLDGTDDTDRWHVPPAVVEPAARAVPEPATWTGVLAPRNGRTVVAGAQTWEAKLSNSGAWDFKASAAIPWYRTRRLVVSSMAVAVVAIVATGILMLVRSPRADESVSPTTPGTAEPTPAEPTPALSSPSAPPPPALPAPPPPPPPPPTAAEEITGPATRPYSPPRRSAPSRSDMPEIGVTRTPVTRAPLSATPPPPRAPDRNSATPGDAPKGGWGRW